MNDLDWTSGTTLIFALLFVFSVFGIALCGYFREEARERRAIRRWRRERRRAWQSLRAGTRR